MSRGLGLLTIVLVSLNLSVVHAEEWGYRNNRDRNQNQQQNGKYFPNNGPVENDAQVVNAIRSRNRVNFVQGAGLVVIKLLPDDRQGLPHQKFVVRTSIGDAVMIVSNLDLCQKIPLAIGQTINVGGEFIWTGGGGLIHWTHKDPRGSRPNGYIQTNGRTYCN